jgi:hypothetical protein
MSHLLDWVFPGEFLPRDLNDGDGEAEQDQATDGCHGKLLCVAALIVSARFKSTSEKSEINPK